MRDFDFFSDSVYQEQTHLAESELASFVVAVTASYGKEQAEFSAEIWLEESVLIDSPPRSELRNWHAVTIAASARFATQANLKPHQSTITSATSARASHS